MTWLVVFAYWAGATISWLPLALSLGPDDGKRGPDDLLAGIVLAVVWPLSVPVLAVIFGVRVLIHRWAGPVPSVLARG
jgi:hypothetical protein